MQAMPSTRPIDLPPYDEKTGDLNFITETSKGQRAKIKWDARNGLFRLDKLLPEGHVFPHDFGFIPGTAGPDGDPVDALLLFEAAIGYSGCRVPARLIGVIQAEQTEAGETIRNDRLIIVALASHLYAEVETIDDLPSQVVAEIEHFFVSYNQMEDRVFKPTGRGGPEEARQMIETWRKGD